MTEKVFFTIYFERTYFNLLVGLKCAITFVFTLLLRKCLLCQTHLHFIVIVVQNLCLHDLLMKKMIQMNPHLFAIKIMIFL